MFVADLFLILFLLFLFGVFWASLGWSISILIFLSFLIIFLCYLKFNLDKKYIIFFILILFLGFFYFHFRIFLEERHTNIIYNQKIEFEGKISGEVLKLGNYQKFKLRLFYPLSGQVEVLANLDRDYNYGDILKILGEIRPARNKFKNLPQVIFPQISYIKNQPDFKFFSYLLKIKNYFLAQFKKYLFYDESALLGGILLGYRADFSKKFKEAMSNSGTAHIVALSGYNVGVLVLAINLFLGYFWNRRKIFWLTIILIFIFVLMTGAEASVVRASIMATFFLLARYFGRIYSFFHSVIFGAFLMVLVNPKILVYDLGFELSFLSLLGISYFKPVFDKLLGVKLEEPGFLNWKENLTTTISAQFGVLPLLLLSFGKVSFVSFLANVLILTLIPPTMFFGFLLGIFGFLKPLGFILGFFISFILKYEIMVINFFGQFQTIGSNVFSWFLICLIYVFLGFYVLKLKEQRINV